MGSIILSGNQYLNTGDEKLAYRIEEGFVLIFLLPISEGKVQRRLFLGRAGGGFVLPSLSSRLPLKGKDCLWQLLILPDGRARLESIPADERYRANFLRALKLGGEESSGDGISFARILSEHYISGQTEKENEIKKRIEDRRQFERKSINSLRASLMGSHERRNAEKAGSGEPLYDAATFLCAMRKVSIASLDTLHSSCGQEYSMQDIARLSGFVCREISLEDRWYTRETEPMLCFAGEDMRPLVCYPKGRRRLERWDPVTKDFAAVSSEMAESLHEKAFVLCRPLPDIPITIKEISRYAIAELSLHDVAVMLTGTLLATFVSLQFARLSETLYDIIIPQGSYRLLFGYGMLMVSYMLGGLCFNIAKGIAGLRLNSRIKYSLQTAIYDRLFHLPESFFRKYEYAELAYRAGTLADMYVNFFNNISQIVLMLLFSGIYMLKMYKYSPALSNIGLGFIAVNIVCSLLMGWIMQKTQRQKARLTGALRSFLFQAFSGINALRSSGAEDSALHEYMKKYVQMGSLELKSNRRQQVSAALSTLVSALAMLALYSAVSKPQLGLSIGGFMGFSSAYSALSSSMLQLASCVLSVFMVLPMLKNSMEILKLSPERAVRGIIPAELRGDIRVAGLSFSYGKSENMLLRDINLHIKPGEYVALVGESGCGKSTLLRLLLGFEKPVRGKIYYDGVELERINKPELRRKMGVVLQDGVLFSGSIYRNIRIARPTASHADVLEAVKAAALEEDIAAMPLGLETLVSEQSQTVSGGQKQRILLARASIGRPKILMLDEATSALDNLTQARVCENLSKLGSTRIVVAHRLSTVKHCDRIIVLDKGRIVEEGSFAQLMEQKGVFHRLASMQSL